jgi:hypothetical protein
MTDLSTRHAAVRSRPVRLENSLCEVGTDDADLFHRRALRWWTIHLSSPWRTAMPSAEDIHSITSVATVPDRPCGGFVTSSLRVLCLKGSDDFR